MKPMKNTLILLLFAWASSHVFAKSADDAIASLVAIGPKGQGNEAASKAWPEVAALGAENLPALLEAMNKANGLGQNWLRAAVDAIAQRTLKNGDKLPAKELKAFLDEESHQPVTRRLAFELIERASPKRAAKLVPGFIDDPAPQLRRDAVAQVLEKAAAEKSADLYDKALRAARDVDQIEASAKALKEAGREVDLPKVMGFLMRWKVIGPFDNTDRKGFAVAYPPEKKIDFGASYEGKQGKVKWSDFATSDAFGMVDVNLEFGELKQVVAYAHTFYESPEAREVQLRLGCKNAWKVWLNGELLFARDEYHRGMRIDQYLIDAKLKKGKNAILVKLCQNEQEQSWTKQWQFQLRVTDASGTALLAANRQPTPQAKPKK
tara:strand:+ start:2174 stop:3307 length:1134 start_codon:yes stop_codon:yes gene_type:complete